MNFLHVGVPAKQKISGKEYKYVESIKLYVTDAEKHDFKIQFTCADEDSPLPVIVREENHIAIKVENIDDELSKYDSVVFAPSRVNDKLRICFAIKDGVLFELTEILD